MITDIEEIKESLYGEIKRDKKDIEGIVEMMKSLTSDGKDRMNKAAAECCMSYYRKWEIYHQKTRMYREWFGDDEWIDREHEYSKKVLELSKQGYNDIVKSMVGDRLSFCDLGKID